MSSRDSKLWTLGGAVVGSAIVSAAAWIVFEAPPWATLWMLTVALTAFLVAWAVR